jgi:hypothetical protein
MEIKTSLFEGTYDVAIELDEYNPEGESIFQVTIGNQVLIISREEWKFLNNFVHNSMDFLDENDDTK